MELTRGKRGAAILGGAMLAALWLPAPAIGQQGGFGPSGLSVRGAAASQSETGSYGLGVWAQSWGCAENAEGRFRFGQKGPDGERGMGGNVRCLARDAAGLIQVSGTIFGSAGEDVAGKDFAATIDVDSSPQRFSTVRLREPGTVAPCSGGLPEFHTVTEGGYQATGGQR